MQTPNLSTFEEVGGKTAWRKDSVRVRLTPAISIEETGLDPYLYGGFMSPYDVPSPGKEKDLMGKDGNNTNTLASLAICPRCQHSSGQEGKMSFEDASDVVDVEAEGIEALSKHGRGTLEKRRLNEGNNKIVKPNSNPFRTGKQVFMVGTDEKSSDVGISGGAIDDSADSEVDFISQKFTNVKSLSQKKERVKRLRNEIAAKYGCRADAHFEAIPESLAEIQEAADSLKTIIDEHDESCDGTQEHTSMMSHGLAHRVVLSDAHPNDSPKDGTVSTSEALVPSKVYLNEESNSPTVQSSNGSPLDFNTSASLSESPESAPISASTTITSATGLPGGVSDVTVVPSVVRKLDARSRWKRVTNTVKAVNHMAANIRSASSDLIEDRAFDEILRQQTVQGDAGGVGADAGGATKTAARSRSKGRKGMEGLLVRQDRCFVTYFQDIYVACLKMPIGHFLIGVFLAPVALGLLFTPLYLLDVDGLTFNGVVPEDATTSPYVSAAQRCLAFLNIFLYALSLSTTFGGAPVAARSPFCLLVANVNTLMAQFLFVFLSGAVFARMSQPSYPIRCSKKAIIKTDDLAPVLGLEKQKIYKVFVVRLVLTGPPPCELVDAKICLTFRMFDKLPIGSVFCSTQDLEVVRPEVSYLRYGLMVRHIIDEKSPVYGLTMKSLEEGDASFSLTVMGMERSSMQPIFHLEDYFVSDGDVIWEGDYVDFIHINDQGQRVLDHSLIDHLKPLRAAARASQAISRMKHFSHDTLNGQKDHSAEAKPHEDMMQAENSLLLRNWLGSEVRKRNLLTSKSTSFTRANG